MSQPHAHPVVPRILFTGKFLCDVSTVNNDPQHYDTAAFRPTYQLPYPRKDPNQNPNGWWNPQGTGSFALVSCKVNRAVYSDGSSVSTSFGDSVVGLPLLGTDNTVQAKCVNLDPMQQGAFEIWGLQVNMKSMGEESLSLSSKLVRQP